MVDPVTKIGKEEHGLGASKDGPSKGKHVSVLIKL